MNITVKLLLEKLIAIVVEIVLERLEAYGVELNRK